MTGVRLADMRLKRDVLVAGIFRDGNLIVPSGSDVIRSGDSVIVITTNIGFQDIHDILA